MAGYTPPKAPDKRARRNKDPRAATATVFEFVPGEKPDLPQLTDHHGHPTDWHEQTLVWWDMWTEAAQSVAFSVTDWSFLVDTALIHHKFWCGDMRQAAELRQRVAKFGVTPEDRARLRMVFAEADEKDAKRGTHGGAPAAGSAYGNLRAIDTAAGGA